MASHLHGHTHFPLRSDCPPALRLHLRLLGPRPHFCQEAVSQADAGVSGLPATLPPPLAAPGWSELGNCLPAPCGLYSHPAATTVLSQKAPPS